MATAATGDSHGWPSAVWQGARFDARTPARAAVFAVTALSEGPAGDDRVADTRSGVADMAKLAELLWRWRGIAADESRGARIAGIVVLNIACVAMVATQLNYVVVADIHVIAVLAPIVSAALIYGPQVAMITGGVAGLAELIHATYLSLDYYEKYFMAPWNSVLLFALVGLIVGLMYAWPEYYGNKSGWRRPAGLVFGCAVGSLFFSLYFQASVSFINAGLANEVPQNLVQQLTGSREVLLQCLVDFLLMSAMVLLADTKLKRILKRSQEPTIRETFQRWLAVVVAMAYMISAAFIYTGISVACRGDAEQRMNRQLIYLEDQLKARDNVISMIADRRTTLVQGVLEEVDTMTINSISRGIALGDDGIVSISEDGVIIASNREQYVGHRFEEIVGAGLRDGFDSALYDASRSSEWDMGGGTLGYVRVAQMGFARVAQVGSYQLMVAMSAADVFQYRGIIMAVTSLLFLAIFGVLYVQASLLLQNVVVRGFDETNEVLSRITGGDLNQVVDVHDSLEFTNLSGGINATVGALKDSIAEAKAGIERELMTAKAIQKSALPSTFPPFPQVEQFDIYANMNAAREVGGDFYDFFLIDDRTLGFLVADVSGKGIPAALFMMAAKTELANYMASGIDLASAIESVNYHLCQGNEAGMFVTVWAATLDFVSGELTYVNAGHNPPLLRHDNEWRWLRERGGLFLGTFDTATYRSQTITLVRSDELLLYTDGVTEAFSVDEDEYGEERLEQFLATHTHDHPHMLVDAVRSDVAQWAEGAEQSDDITMVSLEYGVAPEVRGSLTVPAVLDNLERVLALIHGELARRLCPIDVQNKVDIAIEELFVNVCRYAYADQDEPGNVTVDYIYNARPNAITIQLTDQGVPFDPLSRKDPTKPASIQEATIGGLGIFMAKKSVDDFSYVRDGDKNIVVIKKIWKGK